MPILYIETNFLMSIAIGIKAFLSNNKKEFGKPEVQDALPEAGIIKYFSHTQDFLGWLQSQSE